MNKYLNLSINQIRQLLNLKIWLNQIWNYINNNFSKVKIYRHRLLSSSLVQITLVYQWFLKVLYH
jgi:hypothetical protein